MEKKEDEGEKPPSPVVTCTKWYVGDNRGRSLTTRHLRKKSLVE